MQIARQEIAALLKKSERNLLKTMEIHRQLQALMAEVQRVIAGRRDKKSKAPK